MKVIQSFVVSAVFAIAALTSVTIFAQAQMDHSKMGDMKMDTSRDLSDGEIRKVDKEAGKLTIKHGELKNLAMPPMTMVYQVKEKAMLDKVQAGDKIKFKVINENGKMVVTEIQSRK
jgi:Cu(I)/Ag(I) efflux system periplasmic protein CusF